ncbi:SDR family NAD(P)-dependent oxidoreductase [Chitinilyticum piscinae]|uniref:SDR family NAD(P)-dependent oxidoreductase n=1 Tax=Chitinilyticum piscinae TaxID=2866724 RepID=A0A8J7FNN5_9NEIS|nr:SDR family NAD(P)-dependent oxidoreductase [Chitinilyticum piscinae]MBE9609419.1 SDR family NAD(P)-dependent oxidoreductase [Chitinilyticum piscinae]
MTASRSILITGCSSGIGHHAAHALRARGWRVFASARRIEDVSRLRAEGFEAVLLDVADSHSIETAVQWLDGVTGGRLDALYNNAGFGVPGAVEDLSREAMRHQFETNVFGSIELTNAILPWMRRQGHGRIVFNSSVLGFAAMPARGAYNASKFALEGFADTLRLELAGTGIETILIEPGPIESAFRVNAAREFATWVAPVQRGVHAALYASMQDRLAKPGPSSRFTLSPAATSQALIHAVESRRPAIRYRVTFPTRLFWWLKRLLPTRWLDLLLRKAGG